MKLTNDILNKVSSAIYNYQSSLESLDVFPTSINDNLKEFFDNSIGEEGIGEEALISDIMEKVIPNCNHISHPKYMGLVNSSPLPGAILADFFVSVLNNNLGAKTQSPSISLIEEKIIDVFKDICDFPKSSEGIILPGGSLCNFHGVLLARQKGLKAHGRENYCKMRFYYSDAAHFSVPRAMHCAGFFPDQIIKLPTKNRGEIDIEKAYEIISADKENGLIPIGISGSFGTTGTGAIDDIKKLSDISNDFGMWLHIDACYGGAAFLIDSFKEDQKVLKLVDSISLDAHKWFFIPLTAGIFLTKHKENLKEQFALNASYIPTYEATDNWQMGFTTSRRSTALTIWGAFRAHGMKKIREIVNSNIENSRLLENLLEDYGFEVLKDGKLSVCLARWHGKCESPYEIDLTQKLISEKLIQSGKGWFSTVIHDGKTWLRFNILNIHVNQKIVNEVAEHVHEICKKF